MQQMISHNLYKIHIKLHNLFFLQCTKSLAYGFFVGCFIIIIHIRLCKFIN